jgi:proteasome lid subunit RPN8/RPN11
VTLSRRAHDDIVSHARETAPAECCGLVVGYRGSGGAGGAIVEAVRTRNIAGDPNRFEIHPADHIHARRAARLRGLEVLGFYHSHPHSPATPSATDLAEASYPEHLYLIVSPIAEPADVRLYHLEAGGFKEVPWQLE